MNIKVRRDRPGASRRGTPTDSRHSPSFLLAQCSASYHSFSSFSASSLVPPRPPYPPPLPLQVVSTDGNEVFFKIKRTTKLNKLKVRAGGRVGEIVRSMPTPDSPTFGRTHTLTASARASTRSGVWGCSGNQPRPPGVHKLTPYLRLSRPQIPVRRQPCAGRRHARVARSG